MTKLSTRTAALALVGLLGIIAPGAAFAVSWPSEPTGHASAGVNQGPDGGLQINSNTAGSPSAQPRYFARGEYGRIPCPSLYRWSSQRHMCVIVNPGL